MKKGFSYDLVINEETKPKVNPEGDDEEEESFEEIMEELERLPNPSTGKLILDSITVTATNLVPIYGVLFLGWSSFGLILMFLLEGIIVVSTDIFKVAFKSKAAWLDKSMEKSGRSVLGFEIVFILFFSFFAMLVFGPREEISQLSFEAFTTAWTLILTELKWPILIILILRIQRLFQDFRSSGIFGSDAIQPLTLAGGGWMILLFLVCMLAPIISGSGPNPKPALFALVILKAVGELSGVWFVRLARKLKKFARKKNSEE